MSSGRDYFDDRAELSDQEEERHRRLQNEDDEDSENDDDVPDQYEDDGFVVDEFDDDDDDDDDGRAEVKKRKRLSDDDGDDDDSGGESMRMMRTMKEDANKKKRRRRIKKVGETKRHEAEELRRELDDLQADQLQHDTRLHDYLDYEEEEDEMGVQYEHRHQRQHLQYDEASRNRSRARSEMSDFIVDSGGASHAHHHHRADMGMMHIARDIFGDDDEDDIDDDHGQHHRHYQHHRRGDMHYYDELDEYEDREGDYDYGEDEFGEPLTKYERLKKMFGQEALEQRFMTEQDEIIREKDEPERVQLRQGFRDVSDEELLEEAQWIFHAAGFEHRMDIQASSRQILSGIFGDSGGGNEWDLGNNNLRNGGDNDAMTMMVAQERERCIAAIHNVLVFIFKNKLDVPFISCYRKEYFEPTLKNDEDLWKIFDWDEKWRSLRTKKQRLASQYDSTPGVSSFYRDQLHQANSNEAINDLVLHFQTMFGGKRSNERENATTTSSTIRRPTRRDPYAVAKRNPEIVKMARSFALTPEQYAENLFWSSTRHHTDDPEETPSQMAEQFVCRDFRNATSVLTAARHLNAFEIAHEPFVRSKVRAAYEMNAMLSTNITEKGKSTMVQEFREVSNIQKRPINLFSSIREDDAIAFMNIVKAEREGLIKVDITIDDALIDQCLNFNELYFSIVSDEQAQLWNEQRRMVMDELKKILHETMAQYLMTKYTTESAQVVALQCERELERMAMKGPMGLVGNALYPRRYKRVLACCPSMGDEMTTFVLLDENDSVAAMLQWTFDENAVLNRREGHTPIPKVAAQIKNFQTLLIETQPEVIAVAMTGKNCRKLYDFVRQQVAELLHQGGSVHFVPDDFARAYEHSSRGKQDFPEYQGIVRRAISVGRRLIDPLAEIAGFFNMDNDIVTICPKLHPLQDLIPQKLLLQSLEQAMVRSVSRVGVDINYIVPRKHRQAVLRFVCGLGPRKAAHIISRISNLPRARIELRQQLAEVDDDEDDDDTEPIIGPRVFMNCAAFIKVQDEHEEPLEAPFDRTRIHPESYELAQKELVDALDVEDVERFDIQDLLDEIQRNSSKLDDLDLDAYANELEKRNMGKKHITLKDISRELAAPFKDPRPPFMDPSDEEVFYMAIGESESTLQRNQVVSVSVTDVIRARPREDERSPPIVKVRCMLDNGLVGIIERDNLMDLDLDGNADRRFYEGAMLEAVIIEIHYDLFEVKLDARESSVSERKGPEEAQERSRRRRSRPRRLMRKIDHPYFRNFNFHEVTEYLKDKEPGEIIIRPSSKGDNYLAVSFKFFGDTYINLDVREEKKVDRFSLGKELYVYNRKYDDLDEIEFRCVRPMMEYAKQLIAYDKYADVKSLEEVEQILKNEKQQNPKSIPYRIALNRQYPGRFYIAYLPRRRVKQAHVSISPDGYGFMKRVFNRPSKLIEAFKLSTQARLQKKHRARVDMGDRDINSSSSSSSSRMQQMGGAPSMGGGISNAPSAALAPPGDTEDDWDI